MHKVKCCRARCRIKTAAPFVFTKQIFGPRIKPQFCPLDNQFRQGRNVSQTNIKSLTRKWVDTMGGVANERKPASNESARQLQDQWEALRSLLNLNFAKAPTNARIDLRAQRRLRHFEKF